MSVSNKKNVTAVAVEPRYNLRSAAKQAQEAVATGITDKVERIKQTALWG